LRVAEILKSLTRCLKLFLTCIISVEVVVRLGFGGEGVRVQKFGYVFSCAESSTTSSTSDLYELSNLQMPNRAGRDGVLFALEEEQRVVNSEQE
jgi:hypothetical protein